MTPCVLWTGAKIPKGYGQRRVNGRVVMVHRQAWEDANGPIPEGMTIDHLCRVKLCVNVEHMEVVTRSENSRRAAEWKWAENRCKHGHEFTPENTITTTDGRRRCRTCHQAVNRASHQRRKGVASSATVEP